MKYLTKLFKKQGGASPNTNNMTIEPKFKINDLVQHKFAKGASIDGLSETRSTTKFFEVLYIHTETCSAGTQIFYRCRNFFPICDGYGKDLKIVDTGYGMGESGVRGLLYFREDELKPLSTEDKTYYGVEAGG